ncbi:MAG: hypothetical protein ACRC4W_01115 [Treponemataceae bacterium]
MKKKILSLFVFSLVTLTVYAQLPEGVSAENTIEVEFGTEATGGTKFQLYHLREQFDLFYHSEKVDFVGRIRLQIATDFDDYFAFGSSSNGNWDYQEDLKATALIRPFKGLEFGVGTDIDWEAGERSIWDDDDNRYAVTYGTRKSAGLWDAYRADLYGSSGFGTRFIAGGFSLGAGIPFQFVDDPSDFKMQMGTRFHLPEIFSVGFAWVGDFNGDSNAKNPWSLYLGGSIDFLKIVKFQIFANYVQYRGANINSFAKSEFNLGARVILAFGVFSLTPEFAMTFYDKYDALKDSFRNTFFIAVPLDFQFGEAFGLGVTVAYATGHKAKDDLDKDAFDSKFTVEPRVSIGIKDSSLEISVPIDFQQLQSRGEKFHTGFAGKFAWITRF